MAALSILKEQSYYIDAHLHLQDVRYATDIKGVLERAERKGIQRFFCNATSEQGWDKVCELAEKYSGIVPFWGIHPWFSDRMRPGWDARLHDLLATRTGGIGETGLDKRCKIDFEQQLLVFQTQLQLAIDLQRPLVIHCVRSWGKLVEILEKQQANLPPTMIHSFSGSLEIMKRLVGMGVYLSFSTRLLDPNQEKLRQVCAATPLGHLLLETDGPDQVSLVHKEQGARCNEPQWVRDAYARAAEIKNRDVLELQKQLINNGTVFTNAAALR